MRKFSIFERYWKGRQVVEKPGETTHSAKWDRCVERIKASGGSANAYAVCTAMIGDESFKSMNDDDFMKEVDDMLRKLGISGAGPIPMSLLSMQDLEPREKFQKDEKPGFDSENPHEQPKAKSMGLCVKWTDPRGQQQVREFLYQKDADAFASLIGSMNFGYNNISIEKTHDVAIQHVLNGVKQMVHMMDERLDEYESAGGTEKGAVETTGKKLDEAVKDAEDAETPSEKKSVIDNIKAIQLKRQNATIAARSKSLAGKSFRDEWEGNKKKL